MKELKPGPDIDAPDVLARLYGRGPDLAANIRMLLASARKAEREACAKIADKWATDFQRMLGDGGPAAEIRNRGQSDATN